MFHPPSGKHPIELRCSFLFNLFGSDEIVGEGFDPASYLAGLESPDGPLAAYRETLAKYRMYE